MNAHLSKLIALHALFEKKVRSPGHPVCYDGLRLVSWGEFTARVSARVAVLRQRQEMRWLLAGDDPLAFVIGLLALLYAEKRVVIPPNSQPGTLAALSDAFDARYEDGVGGLPVEPSIACELSPIDPQKALIDLYTSGSTGAYKRVSKTLVQFEAELEVLEAMWGEMIGAATIVATVPHQHIYGLLFRLLWPLASGRVFDAVTSVLPNVLEGRLSLFGRCALISSPAQLGRLPELLSLPAIAPKLVAVYSSGGALSGTAAHVLHEGLGMAPIEVFGSTETGGVAWRQQAGAEGDCWRPFPGHQVGCSENGALILNSSFLPDGKGWTMDDGIELLADGRFRLRGRLDRVVKIEEKRLSLPEMEARLLAHPWVDGAAIVALSGRRQRIGAVLVLSDAGEACLENEGKRRLTQVLLMHLKGYFEAVLLPRHWRICQCLPMTERGKMDYAALVAMFSLAERSMLFPEISRVDEGRNGGVQQVTLDLHVRPEIVHFAGHFPGAALLPGVVQIDWAVHFARQYLPLEGVFLGLENLKFLGVVVPDARLQLLLAWDAERKRLDFTYATSLKKYSVGRILFGSDFGGAQ